MGDVYVNGKWVGDDQAVLPAFHTGLLYGESVFESIPFYQGRPLFWRDHVRRLEKGCAFLGWPAPSEVLLKKVALQGWRRWKVSNRGILRFNWVCPLKPEDTPGHPRPGKPVLLGVFRQLRHDPAQKEPRTLHAGVSAWRVPGPECYPFQFKTAFYLTVRKELRAHPSWQEMLRLDPEGYVVDGALSSPLLLSSGEVWAPLGGSGGLESVSRRQILKSCASMGWRVKRKAWKPGDVFVRGRELVFVGSGLGVAAVRELSGKPLKAHGTGALRLWETYRKWVGNLSKAERPSP